jgi:hypothetical protein
MIDAQTQKPLKVRPTEPGGGLIDVPAEQARTVVEALQARGVRCWLSGGFMSIDGRPARGYVAVSNNEQANRVQEVLDSIA